MQRLQAERELADYDAAEIAPADARAALVAVERFVAAVKTMLEDPGAR